MWTNNILENLTNFKKHLETQRQKVFKAFKELEAAYESKMRLHEVQVQQTCLTQKSIEMFISMPKLYTKSSTEYTSKMQLLVQLFIDSGYPMNILENEAFRSFCKAMNP